MSRSLHLLPHEDGIIGGWIVKNLAGGRGGRSGAGRPIHDHNAHLHMTDCTNTTSPSPCPQSWGRGRWWWT